MSSLASPGPDTADGVFALMGFIAIVALTLAIVAFILLRNRDRSLKCATYAVMAAAALPAATLLLFMFDWQVSGCTGRVRGSPFDVWQAYPISCAAFVIGPLATFAAFLSNRQKVRLLLILSGLGLVVVAEIGNSFHDTSLDVFPNQFAPLAFQIPILVIAMLVYTIAVLRRRRGAGLDVVGE